MKQVQIRLTPAQLREVIAAASLRVATPEPRTSKSFTFYRGYEKLVRAYNRLSEPIDLSK